MGGAVTRAQPMRCSYCLTLSPGHCAAGGGAQPLRCTVSRWGMAGAGFRCEEALCGLLLPRPPCSALLTLVLCLYLDSESYPTPFQTLPSVLPQPGLVSVACTTEAGQIDLQPIQELVNFSVKHQTVKYFRLCGPSMLRRK